MLHDTSQQGIVRCGGKAAEALLPCLVEDLWIHVAAPRIQEWLSTDAADHIKVLVRTIASRCLKVENCECVDRGRMPRALTATDEGSARRKLQRSEFAYV